MPYAEITDPQSLNKYAYTYNNPLHYVDPDGHAGEGAVAVATKETVKQGSRIIVNVFLETGPAAGGGATVTSILVGTAAVGAVALTVYSYYELNRAQEEQRRLFAGVGKENQKRLEQQKHQQQEQQQADPEPQPATDGAGARSRTPHGERRHREALAGDATRDVGDANRVISEGRQFTDTRNGFTVYVQGSRVVVVNKDGQIHTQRNYTRRAIQQKIRNGTWVESPRNQ